ncbi:unnamed protein product [Schistosoma margrebowiei]|uniref:Helix-turn-helix domain-containing protein n=1 Tax=Schistosoma margrebowiei TaxID=48269 RepID=A0A183LNR3_9TREM|nr:unnamed protein product [Schistosoma margrebowiei]
MLAYVHLVRIASIFYHCLEKRYLNGILNLYIYQKPTYSNRYVDFNSVHPFSAKILLALNLFRRGNKIITSEEDKQKEQKNVISILQFNDVPMKIIRSILKQDVSLRNNNNNSNEIPWTGTAVLPYHHGTKES